MPFPTVTLKDDFNRANEGPPPTGWVNNSGDGLKITSNLLIPPNNTAYNGTAWNTSYGPDMEAEVEVAQVPAAAVYHYLTLRLQTNTNFNSDHYEIDIIPVAGASNDTIEVWKKVSGVDTQLGATISLGADIAVGSKWGGSAIGTTITVYFNGTSVGTRTDSAVTGAGYAGVLASPATPQLYFDNFYAGTVSAGGFQAAWARQWNVLLAS